MVQEKYGVQLTSEERERLRQLIRSGQHSARVITRARILLRTEEGWSANQVVAALDTSQRTVFRTKRRYAEEGLDGVLHDHPQANRYRKLDDKGEAYLIALACSADALRAMTLQPWRKQQWCIPKVFVAAMEDVLSCGRWCWPTRRWSWGWWSRTLSVRTRLKRAASAAPKKTSSSRGGSSSGAIPKVSGNGEFVACHGGRAVTSTPNPGAVRTWK